VEYAYRYREAYDWVFWVKADTDLNLATDFGKIASAVGLPPPAAQPLDETVQAVKRWLETNDRWLLIFDNADTPAWLKPYRPSNPNGRVLITSRAQVFDSLRIAQPFEIHQFPPEDAIAFLFKRTERQRNHLLEATVAELANELGYLPLALEQAGAYLLNKKALSLSDYLKSYRKRRLQLLEAQPPDPDHYPASVATTWAINFQEVEQTTPAAADLLSLSAFLAPDDIPFELLVLGATHLGARLSAALADATDDPLLLPELLEPLTRYSLIRVEPETYCYSIHRMVQAVLRDRMDIPTQQHWVEKGVTALDAAFPPVEFQYWHLCDRLLPHVQAIFQHLNHHPTISVTLARLLNQTGVYLKEQGRYVEAVPPHTYAIDVRERQLGADHPDVANSLNNLAEIYTLLGRYAEAETLYTNACAINERYYGTDHPEVATDLNDLAGLYKSQGRYAEAETLYIRSLTIRVQQLGSDHPCIGTSLNNLALLYTLQGRYTEAEVFFVRSLEICEQQFGAIHPNIAQSLNNLAGLYRSQGRYSEAEPLFVRSLAIREQQLGANYPYVASTLNNLASLYRSQGRYSEAEPLFVRSLAIREQQLRANHPDVATSLNNLALLYKAQERYTEAEPLFVRSLTISEQQLGANHPNVAASLNNLALLYTVQGRYIEAEPLHLRTLFILFKELGAEHPNTQATVQDFLFFLQTVMQAGETGRLSNHPLTQELLRQIVE